MLTDRVDGELARSRGLITPFGQIADPIATIASVALLLDHLGFADEARKVEAAIDADMAARAEAAAAGTPLQRSTSEVGDAIAALLTK